MNNKKQLQTYVSHVVKEELKKVKKTSSSGLTLWHYSRRDEKSITLDPKMFGANSYTKKEKNVSSVPRVFFYLDPKEKETFFDSTEHTLYKVVVPPSSIYDLDKDSAGLKKNKEFHDPHEMLEFVSGWEQTKKGWAKKPSKLNKNIKGVKYNAGAFNVVIWFEPIEVIKVEDEERARVE